MSGRVHVLLFAGAREAVGAGRLDLAVPAEGTPLAELMSSLVQRFPRLGRVAPSSLVFLNGEVALGRRGRARAGDEVAIHPPYSGG